MADRPSAPEIDLSEFDAAKPGTRLKVDVVLEELDEERATKLRAALNRPAQYSAETIAKVLKGWGVEAGVTAIEGWRKTHVV